MNAIQKKRADYEARKSALLAEFDALQAKLAVLAELEAELGETPAPAPLSTTAGLPPSAVATAVVPIAAPIPVTEVPAGNAPAPPPNRPPGKTVDRLVLALSGGPKRVQDVAGAVGCSEAAASQGLRINTALFVKVDPSNRQSPWQLTEAGRQLASRLTPAPAT